VLQIRSVGPLILLGACIALLPACDDTSSSGAAQQTEKSGAIRIGSLSADEALALSEKLKARCAASDMAQLLRFVHYYKLGKRDAALVALEMANDETAKKIVDSLRERRDLDDQSAAIDLDEGVELRRELQSQPQSDCERAVQSGQFKPLSGPTFCLAYDSGILDFLPLPGELLTVAGRLAARKALLKLPRERLRTVPRAAAVMTRYEAKRIIVRQALASRTQLEDELMKQLLDLQWNVTVDLSNPCPS
jgi:hypothetical protein